MNDSDRKKITDYYQSNQVVDYYRRATANLGLWLSEEIVFRRVFDKKDRILELGTGTGRVAIGLSELGYEHILGVDISRPMIQEARNISRILEYQVAFKVENACDLSLDDALFDGAIFSFNGLMQIPGRENRRKAMSEILRIIVPGGKFVFTTHDRANPKFKKFWVDEEKRWNKGKQAKGLLEFGDRYEDTELGKLFIHVPTIEEVREDLRETGWIVDGDKPRSQIAKEPLDIREFSDECRFWFARKPE